MFVVSYTSLGALAQLGAHNTGSVGVRGSNPLCSTKMETTVKNGGFLLLFTIFDVGFCFLFDAVSRLFNAIFLILVPNFVSNCTLRFFCFVPNVFY